MAVLTLVGDNSLTGALPVATNNGTTVLLGNGSGSFVFGVHSTAITSSPSLIVKVQDSDDGVTFGDITGLAFSAITTANAQAVGFGHSTKKFVRLVGTVTGTGTITVTGSIAGFGAV